MLLDLFKGLDPARLSEALSLSSEFALLKLSELVQLIDFL